jgi:uncharacterized protein YdaU (DUF1376 family)
VREKGKTMHYYRHHIGDFLKDTGHLSNDQMGIYLRMLWKYYLDEKPLIDDCESIAFAMRSDEKTVHLILRHFFVLQNDGWRHNRCDKEIADYHEKKGKAVNSANARWSNAASVRTHTERNADAPVIDANQEPRTNNHKPIKNTVAPPIGVTDSVWQDWIKLRKEKRAAVTQTAINGIEREAKKAGVSLQTALETCCERGWTGFKADWLASKSLSKTGQTNQTVMSGLTRGLVGGGNNVKLLGN